MAEGNPTNKSALEKVEAYYLGCAKVALGLTLVGTLFVSILVFEFLRATRHHWPPIKNPEVLVHDCTVLMATYTGNPTREQWPQSVRDLRPLTVMVNSKHDVFIPFSFGGALGGEQWGYLVFADPSEAKQFKTDDKTKLYPTNNPSIFQLEEYF